MKLTMEWVKKGNLLQKFRNGNRIFYFFLIELLQFHCILVYLLNFDIYVRLKFPNPLRYMTYDGNFLVYISHEISSRIPMRIFKNYTLSQFFFFFVLKILIFFCTFLRRKSNGRVLNLTRCWNKSLWIYKGMLLEKRALSGRKQTPQCHQSSA